MICFDRSALAVLCAAMTGMAGCASQEQLQTSSLAADVSQAGMRTSDMPPSEGRPSDEPLMAGKGYYSRGEYGLAERSFRAAVEANPVNVDAWVGLAASYDHLRRFDLADNAYNHAIKLAGKTPQILNNLGYHHLLMGNRKKAQEYLAAAAAADPGNTFIRGNLKLADTWSQPPD